MKKSNRRRFLEMTLAGAGALALSHDLPGAKEDDEFPPGGSAKRVIYLLMRGGMSQFETFNLKEAAHQAGSPNQIPTAIPGYMMSEWLPKLAKRMDRCAVIQSMGNRSSGGHQDAAEYFLMTAYQRRTTIRHPGMGSWTSWHFAKQRKPHANFVIGGDTETAEGWMAPEHAPMLIRNAHRGASEEAFRLSTGELDRREKIWKHLNRENKATPATGEFATGFGLMRKRIEEIVDVKQAPLADQVRYGPHPFGQGCLIARRLAEADASCFSQVILDGWDAPAPYFPQIKSRCEILDQALSALIDDLEKSKLLSETLIVVATSAGRRPDLRSGTRVDHPDPFSCLLAGGGIGGGDIHGDTNSTGIKAIKDPVSVAAFNRTIAWALGIDYSETAFSPSGRPFTMGGGNAGGDPLTHLFHGGKSQAGN